MSAKKYRAEFVSVLKPKLTPVPRCVARKDTKLVIRSIQIKVFARGGL